MIAHERRRAISDLIARKQRVTVQQIQRSLDVSPATLRRDLTEMEKAGQLVRVHGGAVHPQSLKGETSFSLRSREAVGAKRAIARMASEMIPDGVTVYIDASTTCLEIGRRLLSRESLKIVTNSVPLLYEAYGAGVPVVVIGGNLRPVTGALTGILSQDWLERLHLEWAFIGASGLDAEGVLTTELGEATLKTAVIQHSRHRVLAADSSKSGQSSLVRFAEWNQFQYWLTDDSLPGELAARVRAQGPNVLLAKP